MEKKSIVIHKLGILEKRSIVIHKLGFLGKKSIVIHKLGFLGKKIYCHSSLLSFIVRSFGRPSPLNVLEKTFKIKPWYSYLLKWVLKILMNKLIFHIWANYLNYMKLIVINEAIYHLYIELQAYWCLLRILQNNVLKKVFKISNGWLLLCKIWCICDDNTSAEVWSMWIWIRWKLAICNNKILLRVGDR